MIGIVGQIAPIAAVGAQERPRLVVLTDIGGDPDDMQSMRRLMLYSNEFEILGLIASASGTPRDARPPMTRPELIREIVDAYARVWPNLRLHDARYPHPDFLRARIRSGSPWRGVANLGPGRDTEGSRHIVSRVDAAQGPVHVAIWGGAHDLAQALHDVRASRDSRAARRFLSKLRVYAIADQDARDGQPGTGQWIRENFPEVRYVETGPPGMHRFASLFRGMYHNDSRIGDGPVRQMVPDSVIPLTQEPWVEENVRNGHGPLGAGYPIVTHNPRSPNHTRGVKEGDTPSWFFVLPNGLSDPEHPEWGGWGGRFRHESGGHYVDAQDEHWSGTDDPALRQKWTVARWRPAYQNDFAARLDWSVRPFAEANHNPIAAIEGDRSRRVLERAAQPGAAVTFDACESTDPDRDGLSFRWFVYPDPSTYRGDVRIDGSSAGRVTIRVPADTAGETIHLILEVSDDGEPQLTSYRRVVIRVEG